MGKLLAALFLLFISTKNFSQEIQFETKYSEPLAVYQFLSGLSAKVPDSPYKRLFNRSTFNNKTYTDLVARFDSLNVDYGYEFTVYPADQKIGGYTTSFIKRNLILSENVQDFKLRSMGLIPNTDLLKLADLLSAFTPVYEAVIYQPDKKHFDEQLKGIDDLMKSTNLNHYFTLASAFFNSSWDASVPFIFCFYPLPASRSFSATAISNVAVSPIPDSLDGYFGLLSIMLHEMSHILYDEKPLALWKQVDEWFNSNPSKVSRYAYNLFNEAMATAVGNGYLHTQLTGKENPGSWYGVKYISLMAKDVYPVVKDYIINHRSMDQNFVNQYIGLFEKDFSGWLTELDFVMMGRYVLSENTADFNFIDRKYRSGHENKNEITKSSVTEMKKHPATKIIVVNKDNVGECRLIKDNFNELKDWQPEADKDFSYTVFLKDKTWLIIINNIKGTIEENISKMIIR